MGLLWLLWLASACGPDAGLREIDVKAKDLPGLENRGLGGEMVAQRPDLTDLLSAIVDTEVLACDTQCSDIATLLDVAVELGLDTAIAPNDLKTDASDGLDLTSSVETDLTPDLCDQFAVDLVMDDSTGDVGEPSCLYGSGVCIGLTYYLCDSQTGDTQVTVCAAALDPCYAVTCIDEIGCQELPTWGNACSDGSPCTIGDYCLGGECLPGPTTDCNDDNPCTSDLCEPLSGDCMHTPASGPCGPGAACLEGECLPAYPLPPHGPFQGDIMANHSFLAAADLSEHQMAEFFGDGKVLLITFNAGWCKVCKEDTVVLNNLLAAHFDAGLRVLSILYETPSGAPINQGYAQWWAEYFELTFQLWMDSPTADAAGKAEGGILATYRQPAGPVAEGFFPVTLVVCPATMEILYVDKGFYDEIVLDIVDHWLYEEECGNGPAGP